VPSGDDVLNYINNQLGGDVLTDIKNEFVGKRSRKYEFKVQYSKNNSEGRYISTHYQGIVCNLLLVVPARLVCPPNGRKYHFRGSKFRNHNGETSSDHLRWWVKLSAPHSCLLLSKSLLLNILVGTQDTEVSILRENRKVVFTKIVGSHVLSKCAEERHSPPWNIKLQYVFRGEVRPLYVSTPCLEYVPSDHVVIFM
jgi:hypothetical protein